MKTSPLGIPTLVRVLATVGLLSTVAAAQAQSVTIINPAGHAITRPLRQIKPIPPNFAGQHEHPVLPIPHGSVGGKDTAVQTQATISAATVNTLSGFDGVGLTSGYNVSSEPPDTNGSVGATQYVQWVNTAFAVYDKATGNRVYGPAAGNTLWANFTAGNCNKNNDGDPIVLYDKQAQRWIFTQLSISGGPPYYQCIAVSSGPDAVNSTYQLYAYSFGSYLNDYPKVGIWTDGYYFTFNMFYYGFWFSGANICALDRNAILSGSSSATMLCYRTSRSYGGVLPADLDGASGAPGSTSLPPSGTSEYAVNFGSNSLNVWRLKPNFSTKTMSITGPTNLAVSAFSEACNGGTCIPQAGTSQQLDSLADRLMYRLSYRNFGSYASLLVNHAVTAGSSTGIRWYELRASSGTATPTVYQQGTFAPDSNYRWMGSVAQDKQGNIAVGYSESSSSMYPAILFATRAATDPLGQLGSETNVVSGAGYQNGHSRWGDYASVSVDPTDDCTVWFTTEFLGQSGDFIWSTHVQNFKMGTCQ